MTRLANTWLLVAVCACACAVAVPAAQAKGKRPKPLGPVVTVTATGNPTAPSAWTSEAVATCPAGTGVVGGGFSAPAEPGNLLVVHDSFRASKRAWTVRGQAINGSGGSVTGMALCRKLSTRKVRTVAQSVSVSGGFAAADLEPACPAGTVPMAGGFRGSVGDDATDLIVMQRSRALPGGWGVSALNGSDAPLLLAAEAYCLTVPVKQRRHFRTAIETPTQTSGVTVDSPPCPKPTKPKRKGKKRKKPFRLSSGGFEFPAREAGDPIPFAAQSLPVGGIWQVRALNAVSFTGPIPIISQSVCLR